MDKKIKFSLAIPVAPYRDCEILESIKKQDYPKSHYEILIQAGTNASKNRNICIKKAKNPYIYFLDDDGIIPKDFLSKANEFFQKHKKIKSMGGPQLTPKDDKTFAKISGYTQESFLGSFKMGQRYKLGEVNLDADELSLTTANFCAKKEVFKKVGLFNTELWPGEDPEMFDRIKRIYKIAFNPTTIIYHRRRPTLKGLCKQIYNYGKVRQKKEAILGQTASPVFYIPAIFTLYLISLPLTLLLSTLFIIPIIIYTLAIIANGIHITIKEKSPLSLILVPIINLFIHISYGLGIIAYFFDNH